MAINLRKVRGAELTRWAHTCLIDRKLRRSWHTLWLWPTWETDNELRRRLRANIWGEGRCLAIRPV